MCRRRVSPVTRKVAGSADRSIVDLQPLRVVPRLRNRAVPPGFHLEHPTADEGCRSASQGLSLTLVATSESRYAIPFPQCLPTE